MTSESSEPRVYWQVGTGEKHELPEDAVLCVVDKNGMISILHLGKLTGDAIFGGNFPPKKKEKKSCPQSRGTKSASRGK